MPVNAPLINRIADRIESDPDHFDMGSWYQLLDDIDTDMLGDVEISFDQSNPVELRQAFKELGWARGDACGTTCCIAGWATVLADDSDFNHAIARLDDDIEEIDQEDAFVTLGGKLLGLDRDDANRLFMATSTPRRTLVTVLRHLANTGELDTDELRR